MSELAARGLAVRLGGRVVLDGIDLAIQAGGVTAVVGPNGAGKSTLLACLAGLRRPDRGEATLDGHPLTALKPRARARRIGYLPQSPDIAWPLDVRTFVRLGRTAHGALFGESAEDQRAVAAALETTAMAAFAERDVTTLSGGERARALIARTLAGEPGWLLADEPLTGLDPRHQLDAADLLARFAGRGGGVVMTLHDLTLAARLATRVVVLCDGSVVADGPPAATLTGEVIGQVYGVTAHWVAGPFGPLLDYAVEQDPPPTRGGVGSRS